MSTGCPRSMWGELAPPTAPQRRLCHGPRLAIPHRAPRESGHDPLGSGRALALQARLLHVQIVVQAPRHLAGDLAPLLEAAQLLPLGTEQVVHQLVEGP